MEAGDTVSIGIMVQPAWDYAWTPSATVEESDSAITRAYPSTKTQYVLAVTGENSCVATATMVVYITVLPEDTARSSLDFVVNNGQLIDTDGAPRPDIGIYSHQASPMVYCGDNRVSFVHAKIDTFAGSKIAGGWDYYNNHHISQTTTDANGHGTKCAGIIGALRNNDTGVSGIAGGDVDDDSNSGAQLFAFKIVNDGYQFQNNGYATIDQAAEALVEGSTYNPSTGYGYGLNVLSNSWSINEGGTYYQDQYKRLFYAAIRSCYRNASTTVFSRTNEGYNNQTIPTTWVPDEFLLSVGASDENGLRASFSSYGSNMDLLAPGTSNIVYTTNNSSNTYTPFSGTSAAAPHAAGVAALLISHHHPNHPDFAYPNRLAPEDVERIIEKTAFDLDFAPYSVGYDEESGWGKLDAGAALQAVDGPQYTVHHHNMSWVTPTDVTTSNITVSLSSNIGNVAAGLYVAHKHVLTWEDWVPLSSDESIVPLDVWPRLSSSQGFSQSSPIVDVTYMDFSWNENEIGGEYGIEVEATTTCWYIDKTYPGNQPIHVWIPAPPEQLKAAYSIHQRNLNFTGIDEQADEGGVLLYPNPTQGELTLVLSNKETIHNVEVTDAIGQRVTASAIISGSTVTLNVSSLSAGMYLLHVEIDDNERIVRRFIVQ